MSSYILQTLDHSCQKVMCNYLVNGSKQAPNNLWPQPPVSVTGALWEWCIVGLGDALWEWVNDALWDHMLIKAVTVHLHQTVSALFQLWQF